LLNQILNYLFNLLPFLKIYTIFGRYFKQLLHSMEIGQFLGFVVFLTIFTMGFWLMIFLLTFVVPYWLFGNLMENWKLKKEAKKAKS